MNKMDKQIMVVAREKLFGSQHFEGFCAHHHTKNYLSHILQHYEYMRRGDAEENPAFKQPICYIAVVNPATRKVFTYQRSTDDKKYAEKRLQGKYSWGLGGHVEICDTAHKNPLFASRMREIGEEVESTAPFSEPEVIGFVNYETDAVGRVHFGVLCVVETTGDIRIKDAEIAHGGWKTLSELEQLCNSSDVSVEEWSKLALEPLKNYLGNKSLRQSP